MGLKFINIVGFLKHCLKKNDKRNDRSLHSLLALTGVLQSTKHRPRQSEFKSHFTVEFANTQFPHLQLGDYTKARLIRER